MGQRAAGRGVGPAAGQAHDAARAQMRYAVEDARTAGFEVSDDLSVTDRMAGGSAAQRAARPPSYQVDEQGRGAYLYQGKDASVVLNKDGQVVTAWPRSRQGWRH